MDAISQYLFIFLKIAMIVSLFLFSSLQNCLVHFLQVPFSVCTFWFLCFLLEAFLWCLVIFDHLLLFKLIGSFDCVGKDCRVFCLDGITGGTKIPLCLSLGAGQIPQISLFQAPGRWKPGCHLLAAEVGISASNTGVFVWFLCPQVCLVSSRPEMPWAFLFQRINGGGAERREGI